MPFVLKMPPSTFYNLMNDVFCYNDNFVALHLEDIAVHSESFEVHYHSWSFRSYGRTNSM